MTDRIERDPVSGQIVRPIGEMGGSCEWFRQELGRRGVKAHPAAVMPRGMLALEALRDGLLVDDLLKFRSTDEACETLGAAYGFDFVTKAIHWGTASGLVLSKERLKLALSGDPVLTRAAVNSRERNLTWETLIASLTATFASGVEFLEPDVTCTHEGKRVSIAAKVVYSDEKLLARITEGIEQCRRAQQNNRADVFAVVVDIVSLSNQVDILRRSRKRGFTTNEQGVTNYQEWARAWTSCLVDAEELATLIRKSCPVPTVVILFIPLLADLNGVPRSLMLTHLPVSGPNHSPDYRFAKAFQTACSIACSYRPGRDMTALPPRESK